MRMVLAVFLFSAMSAYADCNPDFCANVFISRLYIKHDGDVFVGTSGDESVLNCNAASGVYVTLPHDHPGADKIYSALLAAQMANKRVNSIQVNDVEPGCVIQFVTLDS